MPLEPFINLDDPVESGGKIVGKRRLKDSFGYGMQLQAAGAELTSTLGMPRPKKGVYRFHSFAEANEWMTKVLLRQPEN
ncbi:MAG TPA: hypothetical protein VF614_14920 [Chthoniobacteraceae bacterium]|jgi:hypothetical protein